MPRAHGILKIEIWEPRGEYRQLPVDAQWAYAMLVSQPEINNLGVLPYTPDKWARYSADLTPNRLNDALNQLDFRNYIIVDVQTSELLVRTFIRHDAVWKQPKLVTNARRLFRQLESPKIADYLADRHPWLTELWPMTRILDYEETTNPPRDANPPDTPPDTPSETPKRRGSVTPSETPIPETADKPRKPLPIPLAKPLAKGVTEPLTEPLPEPLTEGVTEGVSPPRARVRDGLGLGLGLGLGPSLTNYEAVNVAREPGDPSNPDERHDPPPPETTDNGTAPNQNDQNEKIKHIIDQALGDETP